MKEDKQPSWWVYMVRTSDDCLYTGIATDVERRFSEHARKFREKKGVGAKYFLSHEPESIVHKEIYESRSEATKREVKIKKMGRKAKLELLSLNIH